MTLPSPKTVHPGLVTAAWLLRGISSVPGELKLSGGRLSFTAFGTGTLWKWQRLKLERDAGKPGIADRMDCGKSALIFDAARADAEVTFPWYYFSGGLKVKTCGVQYKLGFGRPSNTRMPVNRPDVLEAGTRAMEELQEVRKMRDSGKAWKTALIEPSSTAKQT